MPLQWNLKQQKTKIRFFQKDSKGRWLGSVVGWLAGPVFLQKTNLKELLVGRQQDNCFRACKLWLFLVLLEHSASAFSNPTMHGFRWGWIWNFFFLETDPTHFFCVAEASSLAMSNTIMCCTFGKMHFFGRSNKIKRLSVCLCLPSFYHFWKENWIECTAVIFCMTIGIISFTLLPQLQQQKKTLDGMMTIPPLH